MSYRIRYCSSLLIPLLILSGQAGADEPYQLDNKLTVILRPVARSKDVAVIELFNFGSDNDPPGKSGLTHLLEHLYCTSAAGDTDARNFEGIQARYKAGYNEQTGRDFTVFAGVVSTKQLEEELLDAASRMSDLKITSSDLERELPRILQELSNMYGGIPSLAGINRVRNMVWPVPQGGRYGGSPEQIRAITLDDLRGLWHDCYKPSNAVLVIAGGFDATTARAVISRLFGRIPAGQPPPPATPRPPATTGTTNRVTVKPLMPASDGVAAVGWAAPRAGETNYPAFLLLVSRLMASGGNFSPGQLQPWYYAALDDPSVIALQAPLPAGLEAQSVFQQLDARLQAALKPGVSTKDKTIAINSMMMLGTTDLPDSAWGQNLYGLAFSVGRRYQMKLDGKDLRDRIRRLEDADLQSLAASVFSASKRASVVIELEK